MWTWRVFKNIVFISLCIVILLAPAYNAFGASNEEELLEDIQNQVLALRNQFKRQILKTERDHLTIQEHLKAKLKELIDSQQTLGTSYPEFKTKVEEFTALLDLYNDKITALEHTLDTIESKMNQNLNTIETQLMTIKQHGIKKGSGDSPGPGSTQTGPEPPLKFACGELFRAAYRFYREGEYEIAIGGFQKYLYDCPDTQLEGAAQYWIAESLVKLEGYDAAIQEYDRLLTQYPQNDKIPDAYYGKGIALLHLGKTAEAKALFTYVIEHFEGTIAAQKAFKRLEELQ